MNILISGTSKGIGQYLAQHYLEAGQQVFGCSRTPASISHSQYRHFILDVADEKAVLNMFQEIQTLGGVDVLINNAGIASMNHLLTTPYQSVKDIFNVNVFGAFLLMREGAKQMIAKRQGRIVNMLSVATPLHLEGEAVYGASKAALEHLTYAAARELASYGITVNGLGCTPLQTDLIKSVPEDKMKQLLQRQAIPRFAQLEEVSNVIDFFIKPESNFITSQVIYLGGVN